MPRETNHSLYVTLYASVTMSQQVLDVITLKTLKILKVTPL